MDASLLALDKSMYYPSRSQFISRDIELTGAARARKLITTVLWNTETDKSGAVEGFKFYITGHLAKPGFVTVDGGS